MANFEDIFSKENIPASNWFKFAKVGDKIAGTYIGFKDQEGKDGFKPQRVFQLKDKDGVIWNVGIPLERDYIIGRAGAAQLGDILGFHFIKEIPPAKKGHHPAKSIEIYVKHVAGEESFD